jgi:mannose-6-phosphate isomerase-like protein (cupin superfamily)
MAGLRHGSMLVEVFAPRDLDTQSPHDQDELYIVVAGTATLEHSGALTTACAGDVLFVPAFAEHRFIEISEDFQTWVVLYGPIGGEEP